MAVSHTASLSSASTAPTRRACRTPARRRRRSRFQPSGARASARYRRFLTSSSTLSTRWSLRPGVAGQRGALGRLEQHVEFALAGHEIVEPRRRAAHPPARSCRRRRTDRAVAAAAIRGAPTCCAEFGHVDLGQLAVLAAQVQLVVVEGEVRLTKSRSKPGVWSW